MSQLSKIFTFDLDGNLFNTPTSFYFEKKQEDGSWKEIEVSPHAYDANPSIYHNAEYYRFLDNDAEKSYQNFRDFSNHPKHRGPDGLILDIKTALEENLHAPSLKMFKEALMEGQLFAILTARGHTSDNLKRMVKLINEELLNADEKTQQIFNIRNNFELNNKLDNNISDEEVLEKYFDYNGYLPVNNVEWCKTAEIDRDLSSEIKKTLAMDKFLNYTKQLINKVKKQNIFETLSCGFSDDAPQNIKSMITYFLRISHENKYLNNYSLYYTGHKDNYDQILKHLAQEWGKYNSLNLLKAGEDFENSLLKIDIER